MTELTTLQRSRLELGLEDLIPLPQIEGMPEVRGAVDSDRAFEQLSEALLELLRRGRIQVWAGPWQEEPRRVMTESAERLLRDHRRYSYEQESTSGLERVYFVNVENIREGEA